MSNGRHVIQCARCTEPTEIPGACLLCDAVLCDACADIVVWHWLPLDFEHPRYGLRGPVCESCDRGGKVYRCLRCGGHGEGCGSCTTGLVMIVTPSVARPPRVALPDAEWKRFMAERRRRRLRGDEGLDPPVRGR